MRWIGLIVLVASAYIAAADKPLFDRALESQRLQVAQAKWVERGITSYSFTSSESCFCLPEWMVPVRVTVEEGKVIRAVYAASTETIREGTEVPSDSQRWMSFQTVEERFELIRNTLTGHERVTLTVEYDAELGYPRLFATSDPTIQDAGGERKVTDLQPKQ